MPVIWGQVEAVVNHLDGRLSIVVKTTAPIQSQPQVCATIAAHTVIARGIQRVTLADILVGEFVEMAYRKSPDGLEALTVYARSPHGIQQ
jgi:hypothetical protein